MDKEIIEFIEVLKLSSKVSYEKMLDIVSHRFNIPIIDVIKIYFKNIQKGNKTWRNKS